MDCKNDSLDNYSYLKEDQLILKTEPVNEEFIKKEEIEVGEYFVVPGLVGSLKVEKDLIKEESFENEEIASCSSSNV